MVNFSNLLSKVSKYNRVINVREEFGITSTAMQQAIDQAKIDKSAIYIPPGDDYIWTTVPTITHSNLEIFAHSGTVTITQTTYGKAGFELQDANDIIFSGIRFVQPTTPKTQLTATVRGRPAREW